MSGAGAVAGGNGDYRIEVTNFGPIRSAAVDLRPLTVFAGPSNTGKSYLAMLVYALHECFGPPFFSPWRLRRAPYWHSTEMEDSLPDRDDLAGKAVDWWISDSDAELPEELSALFIPALERVSGADRYLSQEIRRCFGVNALGDLVRLGSSETGATISLVMPPRPKREPVRYHFEFGQDFVRMRGDFVTPLYRGMFHHHEEEEYATRIHRRDDARSGLWETLGAMLQSLIRPLVRPAYYLPAGRTGVMQSHQVVVSALIQGATAAGLRPSTHVPVLSGVLADYINDLIEIGQRPSTRVRNLANAIERNLLTDGVMLQRAETGYPSFTYRPANWETDLPLMRTSSMVSELPPVVLYLRYLVRPRDLLIIEEPESHLHPALQTVFARELAS